MSVIIGRSYIHTKSMEELKIKIESICARLQNNSDVITREVQIGTQVGYLVFVDTLTEEKTINESIIAQINVLSKENQNPTGEDVYNTLNAICILEELKTSQDIVDKVLQGYAVLITSICEPFALKATKDIKRPISEPPTSAVMHGPRDGFTEDIKTNIALMRKRLPTESLKIEDVTVGRRTKTAVRVLYLSDVADKSVVSKIMKKLSQIDIDGVVDTNYITEFIAERPYSMFKQVGIAEKPDIITAKVLEGRVAIFVDGSPAVITLPYILLEDLQSSNDYYFSYHRATFLRMLRLVGIVISILIPGFYVAMELYHYKIFPLKFLISIINTTQNLPLNPFAEVLFILILFEILYEASIRMPKYIGMALSIVGALILGDTAVQAGLISPPGVMIVALSSITVYTTPDLSPQLFMIRFIMVLLGGFLGYLGIMFGVVVIGIYLLDMDIYGAPYFAPFAPYVKGDNKDFVFKRPVIDMKNRPKSFSTNNKKRLK